MIPFLIGVLALVAATRVGAGRVRGRRAAAWAGALAVLTLGQLALGAGRMERWRISLLALRQRVAAEDGRPLDVRLTLGGGYDAADLPVPGSGDHPVAVLRTVGDPDGDSLAAVVAVPAPDAGAVALVEERGFLGGTSWRVLGGVPFGEGDTLEVQGRGEVYRLTARSVPDTLRLVAGAAVPLPWVRLREIREVGHGDRPPAGSSLLPGVDRSPLQRLRGVHPSVFQRTYPLADVLTAVDSTAAHGLPGLGSFFYYRKGDLHVALLDREVTLRGGAEVGDPALAVWSAAGGGRRVMAAGLAHRDYPEPDLRLPERYGVRPLRAYRMSRTGPWLDASLAEPEVRDLDRAELAGLHLPGDPAPGYRVRLAPGRDALSRRAVAFAVPSGVFAEAAQAVLRLPDDATAGGLDVVTPSGTAALEAGDPFALGAGDRALVLRVDGLGTRAGFWAAHLALFGLLALVFGAVPMTGPVFALAASAAALLAVRLLLGVSATVAPPFVQEAQQTGLWLLVAVPWAVALLGEVGGGLRLADPDAGLPGAASGSSQPVAAAGRSLAVHAVVALSLVTLAAVLFPEDRTRRALLGGLPLALLILRVDPGRRIAAVGARLRDKAGSVLGAHPRLLDGWTLGALLLGLRVVLEWMGWREQVGVGGTRVGVSVLYTPLALAGLALVLHRQGTRVAEADGMTELPRAVSGAVLHVGAYVLLALVAVSAWVSDFGIGLVLLPGALAALALRGAAWAPAGPTRRAALLATGLPLVAFVAIQAAPQVFAGAWRTELQAADVRLREWNRNELLLLDRGDPAALGLIGQRRSEALAVMRETMRSYTRRNWTGRGFLRGRVSEAVVETAPREHAVSALLANQWGLMGVTGLVLALLSLLPPALGLWRTTEAPAPAGATRTGRRHGRRSRGGADPLRTWGAALLLLTLPAWLLPWPFDALVAGLLVVAGASFSLAPAVTGWTGAWGGGPGAPTAAPARIRASGGAGDPVRGAATGAGDDPAPRPSGLPVPGVLRLPWPATLAGVLLLGVAGAGIYMVLANYGLVFFTGKNVYLLGLDSAGDALEAMLLLGIAAWALGRSDPGETPAEPLRGEWWRQPATEGMS